MRCCDECDLLDTWNGWYNSFQGEVKTMAERKSYEREFKVEIARQVASGSRSARSMASEIGVHENTIYKWVKQYTDDPEQAFPGTGHMKPEEEELHRAKRRIRELEEEVQILKKFAAYMAKNDR
jgi:transposase